MPTYTITLTFTTALDLNDVEEWATELVADAERHVSPSEQLELGSVTVSS